MKKKPFINNETLREIRNNTDWRALFCALGLRKDEKRSQENDWWACSPLSNEKTPSFHLSDKGFYCFSTHESGGVIELVQKVMRFRTGQVMNCYEAGRWLVEQGLSFSGKLLEGQVAPVAAYQGEKKGQERQNQEERGKSARSERKKEIEEGRRNAPIRQNLIPCLSLQGEHPELVRRGISRKTCEYLGCGYLDRSQGQLAGRIVFQVRGIEEENGEGGGKLRPVILTHVGRATSREQEEEGGKWKPYKGFLKSLELYNVDQLFLDENAVRQAKEEGRVIVAEGCFDVAKLIEAGICNVVASFGAHLYEEQALRLRCIAKKLGVKSFFMWYDRDEAGMDGQQKALELLKKEGFLGQFFPWDTRFSVGGKEKEIPDSIRDVCDFSVEQLKWLRRRKVI